MLRMLIDWSIKNRILVLLLSLLLLAGGVWAVKKTAVDALPDLSDPQVIVWTKAEGMSPQQVEDQITYPLTNTLLSSAGAKTVRSYSFFGSSMIYVIFEEGTDLYFARSRVGELLNSEQVKLPTGIKASLGPDASGLGWVYEYALMSDKRSLAELRSLQDWTVRYALASVPGVAEVASVGGYVKEVQVRADPDKLRNLGITLSELESALAGANGAVGGEILEQGETEFMIRSQSYLKDLDEVRQIPVKSLSNRPILVGDLAVVDWGPAQRRGAAEINGQGEVAGGIVVMRYGQNAKEVIQKVQSKLEELQRALPPDVKIVPTYDRSSLIDRAIANLSTKLIEEMLVVALVCGIFLMHLRSALVAVVTLPLALLFSFLMMKFQGVNANLMSLGGLAIAIGAMVDAAIILVENAHKHLSHNQELPPSERREHWEIIALSCKEVGPALFWSLSLITISFAPIFALENQEGRLFGPLAWTKTYAMAGATMLSLTLVPVLMGYVLRGKIPHEERNPLNRLLVRIYGFAVHKILAYPKTVLFASGLALASSFYPLSQMGSEFMPPLDEGDLLYMPTTAPGISMTKAKEILRRTDAMILSVPEVKQVFGKVGRAETATDPAGLDMLETVIELRPKNEWRPGMTIDKIIVALDSTVRMPGLTNAWTKPIKARIDMLSTGIKTPLGLKISGPNLDTLQLIATEAQGILSSVPGTASVFAEKAVGGNYVNIQVDRAKAASYGLGVSEVQKMVETGMGGTQVGTWISGLERYSIQLRFNRDFRDNLDALRQLPIALASGGQVALGEVATLGFAKGPMLIRSEGGRPNAWVFVDTRESDLGGYIQSAQQILLSKMTLPQGYQISWSGEYESMQRAKSTMMIVIPITLLLMVILLYLNTRSLGKTALILCAVPFSLIGAFWALWGMDYQLSVAVAVGLIALAGLDAETGAVMLLYLEQSLNSARSQGKLQNLDDLKEAIYHGAVMRVRPKIMTACVILAGLIPILWSDGSGSDVMKRIALPMVGGVLTSVLMELLVYPAVVFWWEKRKISSR